MGKRITEVASFQRGLVHVWNGRWGITRNPNVRQPSASLEFVHLRRTVDASARANRINILIWHCQLR